MSITFIHAADIHLDRPFLGLNGSPETMARRIRQSTFTAFSTLVDTAIARKVDFIILSGDIFDGSSRGLRAETRLRKLMHKLSVHGIEVYMIHGNHDPLDGHWSGLSYGENVHVFGPRPQAAHFKKADKLSVAIYGFSYPTQHVSENMVDLYEKVPGADYHVALLHGSIKGNVDHDVYAPFTITDLLNKKMDYWALGHIHKREVLNQSPAIVYPGSLQGLSIKETGAKGFYIVTLNQSQTQMEFVETSDVLWDDVVFDAGGIETFDALVRATEELKEEKRGKQQGVLVRIRITGQSQVFQGMYTSLSSDLLEVLRTGEDERHDFVWVTDIVDDTTPIFDRESLRNSPHFMGDVVRLIDRKSSIKDDLQPLYHHQQAKKYLSPLSQEEQEAMMKDAEKLLLSGLHKIGQTRR
jgi:DNA repair protein SbcD/Mre11